MGLHLAWILKELGFQYLGNMGAVSLELKLLKELVEFSGIMTIFPL